MDIVSKTTRSKMMAGIKGTNTQPEKFLRSWLHRSGFRFRLHTKNLPGKPDILLPRYQAVILVHGCFWHGHGCALFKWPATRSEFWQAKIKANCERDARNISALKKLGWRVAVMWECELRQISKQHDAPLRELAKWLIERKKVAF
jgi:DNA mismatch endonuclease (patch repair protein)